MQEIKRKSGNREQRNNKRISEKGKEEKNEQRK